MPSSTRIRISKDDFPAAQKYTQQTASTTLITRVLTALGGLPSSSLPSVTVLTDPPWFSARRRALPMQLRQPGELPA
jgi:hypothetical protein